MQQAVARHHYSSSDSANAACYEVENHRILHLQQSSPRSVPHAAVAACSHKAASPVIQIAFILHCNPKWSAMVARRNVWKLQSVESSHAIQDSIQQNGKRCHVCKRRASHSDIMIPRLRHPCITVADCCLTFGYACILRNRSKQSTAHSLKGNPALQSPRHARTQLHNAGARCRRSATVVELST